MARGFGSVYGTGATGEAITGSGSVALATGYSLSLWTIPRATGQSGNGAVFIIGGGTQTLALRFDNLNAGKLRVTAPWSTTRGDWLFPLANSTNWNHIGISYDGGSVANSPVCYVNGVSVSVAAVATQIPLGTFGGTLSSPAVGNSAGATIQYDGVIAEVGLWKDAIFTASQMAALAKGLNPMRFAYTKLALYYPLFGLTGEPDWSTSHGAQTITGTKFQPHAPVTYWQNNTPVLVPEFTPAPSGFGPSGTRLINLPRLRMRARI